jgi:hypothetical protein
MQEEKLETAGNTKSFLNCGISHVGSPSVQSLRYDLPDVRRVTINESRMIAP